MFDITIFIFIWSLVIKLEANSWFKFLLVRSGKITGILEDVAEAGVLEKDRSALNKSLHNVSVKSKNEKKKKYSTNSTDPAGPTALLWGTPKTELNVDMWFASTALGCEMLPIIESEQEK